MEKRLLATGPKEVSAAVLTGECFVGSVHVPSLRAPSGRGVEWLGWMDVPLARRHVYCTIVGVAMALSRIPTLEMP